jgi:hypothetical protein
MLAASVDDEQVRQCLSIPRFSFFSLFESWLTPFSPSQAEAELSDVKSQAKMLFKRMSRNSAPEASIESGQYNLQ